MDHEPTGEPEGHDRDDQDRVVSRRVRNPTQAEPGDEAVYRAADPAPDGDAASAEKVARGAGAGTATAAAAEIDEENESEPVRSE